MRDESRPRSEVYPIRGGSWAEPDDRHFRLTYSSDWQSESADPAIGLRLVAR